MARMAIGDAEKKQLMVLGGLLAVLAIVVVAFYIPRGGAPDDFAEAPPAEPAPEELPPDEGGPPSEGAAGAAAPSSSGITAASLIPISRYRLDPFERVALPIPPPPPPPPPPVVIPEPVEIVPPHRFGGGGYGGFNLPPMGINREAVPRTLTNLPPIVPRRVASAPTAPRLFTPPGGQTAGTGIGTLRSQNKRLSGVVIGDSVRALLEISVGGQLTTRIVQPGDEVDGIRILRLERVLEGGQTITRLVVSENGQEQFVELRPGAPRATEGGMEPDEGFPGGMPFGMP